MVYAVPPSGKKKEDFYHYQKNSDNGTILSDNGTNIFVPLSEISDNGT